MREDLLHFIWKYKKLPLKDLVTSKNEAVVIVDAGRHNHLAGPDFFNAQVRIDEQLWAGNVEIHIKSSDWYAHHHEKDRNYDNVILHVVWEEDVEVFRSDNSEIPTLQLKNYISDRLLGAYQDLFDKKGSRFINCEKDIGQTDAFTIKNWLERLFFERLERKSNVVFTLLEDSKTDWENVFFVLLLKNFGLKINGDAFLSLAKALDFSIVRKLQHDPFQLESVLYGMSHLLDDDTISDEYHMLLKKEYRYLQHKFSLEEERVQKPEFFKLRPPNFPTIRLSQLASLYHKHQNLFSLVIEATTLEEIYTIFDVSASRYWDDHFTFGKSSRKGVKKLTKKFIDLLIVNTILPIKFCYSRHLNEAVDETISSIALALDKEENSVVSNFAAHGVTAENAMESQGILQLYNEYCTKNKCLQCTIGTGLLTQNS
ncbi:DUF2851 family protein [uncultured Kriegella sp.]|mgnify:CR=1 FL=1|uniref:DUF2851 family protein n=1 Tax=uncultured Kriegella sp. TaxID=1798910 RepID=UPI0030D74FFF|tara:strand:- start:7221 stop:8504 length:1284 start_codon:yes stop_codon:yes gene_type:complete